MLVFLGVKHNTAFHQYIDVDLYYYEKFVYSTVFETLLIRTFKITDMQTHLTSNYSAVSTTREQPPRLVTRGLFLFWAVCDVTWLAR